jgi:hypothetical protein
VTSRPIILTILVALSTATLDHTAAAADDPIPNERPPVIVTTLQMDPEHPREIIGWWSSPTELVHLAADGRYRHWKGHDRFAAPIRSGRWHRENHAVFWLESYAIPKPPRSRAALWLRDDALMADVDATGAFRHHETPPRIPADHLLGLWTGDGGTLEFRPDSTYIWTAPPSASPIAIGGQRGRWRLTEDGRLRLDPQLADQPPVLIGLTRDAGESPEPHDDRIVELRSIVGVLHPPSKGSDDDAIPVNPGDDSSESDTAADDGDG